MNIAPKIPTRWNGLTPCLSTRPRSSPAITEFAVFHAGEPTFSVSELGDEIREIFHQAFPALWVVGEVQRPRMSQRGHLYLELVEKGRRDEIVGKLDAVLWRSDHQRVRRLLAKSEQEIADGIEIRCRCQLDFYPPGGRLQLVVREIDPLFTLGNLERRRRETLAALAASGLLDRNRSLKLPDVVLNVGLITSEDSAAFHDFLSGLVQSIYGFRICFRHAAMQGQRAEREVVAALAELASLDLDAIVLIRGGGSRTDLSAFDSRLISEAIARCPLPVLTGLGHEIDQAIADRVSHLALKTPTEAAAFLVERIERLEVQLEQMQQALERRAQDRIGLASRRLDRLARTVDTAQLRLRQTAERVQHLGQALQQASRRRLHQSQRDLDWIERRCQEQAPRILQRRCGEPELTARRIVDRAVGRLRETRAVIDGMARLCDELSPQRVLERGYSMTRNAAGQLLRHPEQAGPGERIQTRLAGGVLKSRVET